MAVCQLKWKILPELLADKCPRYIPRNSLQHFFYICALKKASAILFLSIYLLSTTTAAQLMKLPVVFQHFSEHQQENKRISFTRFLAVHYLHGSPKDKDYDRDMQLPFKTSGDCISCIAIAFVSLITPFTISKPVEIKEKKNYIVLNQVITSSYLASIWQPPKYC
jgi:hypothetical protein